VNQALVDRHPQPDPPAVAAVAILRGQQAVQRRRQLADHPALRNVRRDDRQLAVAARLGAPAAPVEFELVAGRVHHPLKDLLRLVLGLVVLPAVALHVHRHQQAAVGVRTGRHGLSPTSGPPRQSRQNVVWPG
jgi:hypothetical protein